MRDLQDHFSRSPIFAPWLEAQKRSLIIADAKPKHLKNIKAKLGHGGTLDPMATGVLIVGMGKGTKCLQRFLECTKTYECVVLFGAATDSYDAVGKVVSKADYEHVTKELVEEKLAQFRGKIMQKPSVFSALKVDGKKMYEYARQQQDEGESDHGHQRTTMSRAQGSSRRYLRRTLSMPCLALYQQKRRLLMQLLLRTTLWKSVLKHQYQ